MKMLPSGEIAKQLSGMGVMRHQVIRAMNAGELRYLPLGGRRLIDLDEARAYFSARQEAKKARGVGIDAVSGRTGMSVSAIRKGVHDGWIPCRKNGRALCFDLDEVFAAIEARMESK